MRKSSHVFMQLVVLGAMLAPSARAQSSCGAIPTDEFGVPLWDELGLETEGEYTEWLMGPWEIPGLGEFGIGLSFDVSTDATGHHWYTPTFFSAMYMAFTGWRPDFPQAPEYALLNPVELAAALAGHYEELGISAEDASAALNRQVANLAVLSANDWTAVFRYMGASADFWINLNLYLLTSGESFGTGFMGLIYCGNPEGGLAGDLPGGNATPVPRPLPTPTPITPIPTVTPAVPVTCPRSTLEQRDPVLVIETYPPYPVIVGQDPNRTGFTLSLRLTSYPVIYTWWEEITTSKYWCRWDGVGGHSGCPEGSYAGTDAPDGLWHPFMLGASDWYATRLEESRCEQHVDLIPDPVDLGTLDVTAHLQPVSRDWITSELARRYPGTQLLHPDWAIIPYPGWPGQLYGDGSYLVEASINVPFEDPGYYDLVAQGRTTGTLYTAPRTFFFQDELPVYLVDSALIR